LKKVEEKKLSIHNKVKKDSFKFPNLTMKFGLIFIFVSFLAGDVLQMLGVRSFIFQQNALSIGTGFFGLGLILWGSFQSVMLRLDKIIDDKGVE